MSRGFVGQIAGGLFDGLYSRCEQSESGSLKQGIQRRAVHLITTPVFVVTDLVDTLLGVGMTIATLATAGQNKTIRGVAMIELEASANLLSVPYRHLLQTINPEAQFNGAENDLNDSGNGLLASIVKTGLQKFVNTQKESNSFFRRHVTTRLGHGLMLLSAPLTRTADLAIGLVAALFSFLTLGKIPTLNKVASKALEAPGIMRDLFQGVVKTINPYSSWMS